RELLSASINPMVQHTGTGLPAVTQGALAMADYDLDGKLDVAVIGYDKNKVPITQLWHNNGGDSFSQTDLPTSVVGLHDGALAWGDYNNDGKIDLALTGFDAGGTPHTYLLKNNGNNTFTDVTATALPGVPGVGCSSVTWGMVDADGWRDLMITGQTNPLVTG